MGMLERASIGPGETVVVTGASGGVGLALVQLAAARGTEVIAVTSGGKAAEVRAAGAGHAVDRDAVDLGQRIDRLSPAGVDAVADVAGGPLIAQLMALIRDADRWVIAGAVAGAVVDFDLRRLYLHHISLIGSSMHTHDHFAALVHAARSGAVQRVSGHGRSWTRWPAGSAHRAAGRWVALPIVHHPSRADLRLAGAGGRHRRGRGGAQGAAPDGR